MRRRILGQSVIEYLIIFISIALIAGFILGARGVLRGHFNDAVAQILD